MKAILNLTDWGLAATELEKMDNYAVVRLSLAYPGYQAVLAYPPAERRRRLAALLRANYRALAAALPPGERKKIGSHYRPAGIRQRLPVRQLPALLKLAAVEGVWLEEVEGLAPKPPVATLKCWSIKARFAVQIEQQKTGLQTVEERMLLVAAPDEEAARQQLRPAFASYAEPYLNADGYLVRWQFEQFLDAYEVEAGALAGQLPAEGLEVFSETKSRRLTSAQAWLPGWPAPPAG